MPCVEFGAPKSVGKAEAAALSTLSGLVASREQPGVLYANPDRSGARFFALDKAGHTLVEFTLEGASSTDCEDIAIGPGPKPGSYLHLGDIGDNAARPGTGAGRKEIRVLRVPEPAVELEQKSASKALGEWQELRFVYPDRPHDSETLMVDPANGDYLIVTREQDGSAVVFRGAASAAGDAPTELERLVSLEVGASGANAGDISPNGDRALIRSYEAALLFVHAPGQSWAEVFAAKPQQLLVANEVQSEGATFGADGKSWLSSGESDPTIYEATATCP